MLHATVAAILATHHQRPSPDEIIGAANDAIEATVWAPPERCPFELNMERFDAPCRCDHWDGGYYFEVTYHHSRSGQAFWGSDRLLVVDFGFEFVFAENGCDEHVSIHDQTETTFIVAVKPDAGAPCWPIGL